MLQCYDRYNKLKTRWYIKRLRSFSAMSGMINKTKEF